MGFVAILSKPEMELSLELGSISLNKLKKESQHICFSCCQSDDEYYGTQQHLKMEGV